MQFIKTEDGMNLLPNIVEIKDGQNSGPLPKLVSSPYERHYGSHLTPILLCGVIFQRISVHLTSVSSSNLI